MAQGPFTDLSIVCIVLVAAVAALPLHDSEIDASASASKPAHASLNLPEWLAVARCRSVCVNEFVLVRERSDAACEADANCSVCWDLCFRLTAQFALYRAICASVRRACKPGVVRACETACEHRLNQSALAAAALRVRTDVVLHAAVANRDRSKQKFTLRFDDVDFRGSVKTELAHENRSLTNSAVAALQAMRVPLYWLVVRPRALSGQQWTSLCIGLDRRFVIDWSRSGIANSVSLEEPERLAFVVLVVWPLGILGTSADVLLELPATTPFPSSHADAQLQLRSWANQSLSQSQAHSSAEERSDAGDARFTLVLVGIVALVALTALAVLALGLAVLVRALRSKEPPRLVRMVREASLRGRRSIEGFVRDSFKRSPGEAFDRHAGALNGNGNGARQQKQQQENVELVAQTQNGTAVASNESSVKAPLRAVKSADP